MEIVVEITANLIEIATERSAELVDPLDRIAVSLWV